MFFTECILEAKQTHCFIKKKKKDKPLKTAY